MPREELTGYGYSTMYMIVMFDLPVKTKEDRKEYRTFRKQLLSEGFTMLQYSVYSRFCATEFVFKQYSEIVKRALPPAGSVRIVGITTRQFEKMENFVGAEYVPPEPDDPYVFL